MWIYFKSKQRVGWTWGVNFLVLLVSGLVSIYLWDDVILLTEWVGCCVDREGIIFTCTYAYIYCTRH